MLVFFFLLFVYIANEDDYAALKYDHSRVVRAHTKPMEDRYDIGDELGRSAYVKSRKGCIP